MPINWDILLHELDSGKCVLCIGPDVYSTSGGVRIEQKLANTLQQNSAELGIRVYEDGWFHYRKERDELATWFKVKQFYETQLPVSATAIFQAITPLPFHLILNFTPDYQLREAFRTAGRPFEFDCLYKTPEASSPRTPSNYVPERNKPLLFNLLGEIDDKDSLVMTYDDLFGYMEAIFEKKRMPQNVKLKIQQATHFIFLGMPLDKWYFHLFMRVLNMHKDTTKSKRVAATYAYDEDDATFCEEQYTLTFVKEDIASFINLLQSKWHALQAQNKGNTHQNVYERWRELVRTGDDIALRKLFEELKPLLDSQRELSNQQILLEMQWRGFVGTTFETEMSKNAMKTQVLNGILYLIDQSEQLNLAPA